MTSQFKLAGLALCNIPFLLISLPEPFNLPSWLFAPLISLCLFVIPGLAWVTIKAEEGTLALFARIFARSVLLTATIIGAHLLLKIIPTKESLFLINLLVVNLGLFRKTTHQNWELLWQRMRVNRSLWIFLGLASIFLFTILFLCALFLVPPMLDHDWDSQSGAYGLIHTLTPLTVTDRGVLYYFCDPPFLSFQIGLVALARGSLDKLAYHYEIAKHLKAKQGALPDASDWREASRQTREHFLRDPHLLETRIPTLFFATATLPFLFVLLKELTQSLALSAVGCLLYFTFPEVLVRFSYGGYTATAVLLLLIIIYGHLKADRRTLWLGSFLGAIAKRHIVILPLALALWSGIRETGGSLRARLWGMVTHPASAGYLLGTFVFFGYGFLVHPDAFWQDHVRETLWNRLFHINTESSFPSVKELWLQFNQMLGFPFLPLAVFSVVWLWNRSRRTHPPLSAIPLWIIIGSIVFSIVDFRQTKHFIYIVPALVMATMCFIAHQRGKLRWSLLVVVGFVIVSNSWRIWGSLGNLLALHPTGNW